MAAKVGALVLAAGFSSRYGSIKLCAELNNGHTVFAETLQRIRAAVSAVTVVTRPELVSKLTAADLDIHTFDRAEKGMGATLAFGISLVQHWDACLICLADMPFVEQRTYFSLAENLSTDNIVIPTYRSHPGNPVGFGSEFFSELQLLSGDSGGRPVVMQHPASVIKQEVDDAAILWDIDTPDDLARFQSKTLPDSST